jgi:FkbM family methyltransferase
MGGIVASVCRAMDDEQEARLHGQSAELELLRVLRADTRAGATIDVGAESGELAASLRAAGWGPLHLLEPDPQAAAELRRRFDGEADVEILELAAGNEDETVILRLAETPEGEVATAFNTTLPLASASQVQWSKQIEVEQRSLASLAASGEVPGEIGLLKVDTEGAEDQVLAGAAGMRAEIVMVEHWLDLPESLGPCPWTLERIVDLVAPLGLTRFVCVRHRPLNTQLELDHADLERGEWSNLIFVADHLVAPLEAALPALAAMLQDQLLERAEEYHRFADERLAVIEELRTAAEERLRALEEVDRERLRLEQELGRMRSLSRER